MRQYKTSAKRKLLSKSALRKAAELSHLGVPVARILKDLNLEMSRPVLATLIDTYKLMQTTTSKNIAISIEASLFPPWLTDIPAVQSNPEGWRYKGRFPLGQWLEPQ